MALGGFHRPVSSRAVRAAERLSGRLQGSVIRWLFALERKDEFAVGVIVSHTDLHFLERLVAAYLSCVLDGFQIQRGTGIADPVFVARIIEADSSMS